MKRIFHFGFKDINEITHSVTIFDTEIDDPTATPIELTALSPGYTINWSSGISNIIQPGIISSLLEFSIINNNKDFDTFLTFLPFRKENRYIVSVTNYINPVLQINPVWIGVLSLDFQKIDDHKYSIVKMSAVDGVAWLQSEDVEQLLRNPTEFEGRTIYPRQSILQYIIYGLNLISSSKLFDLTPFNDNFLCIKTNWYDSGMPNDPDKDPLDMVSITDDFGNFIWHERRPREGWDGTTVVDVEKYNIYEQLDTVLIHFNCILLMNKGRWYIVQRDLLMDNTTTYRVYKRDGTLNGITPTITETNSLSIEQYENNRFRANGSFYYLPGLKQTKCTYLVRGVGFDGLPSSNLLNNSLNLDEKDTVYTLVKGDPQYPNYIFVNVQFSQKWDLSEIVPNVNGHYKFRVYYRVKIKIGNYWLQNTGGINEPWKEDYFTDDLLYSFSPHLQWIHEDNLKETPGFLITANNDLFNTYTLPGGTPPTNNDFVSVIRKFKVEIPVTATLTFEVGGAYAESMMPIYGGFSASGKIKPADGWAKIPPNGSIKLQLFFSINNNAPADYITYIQNNTEPLEQKFTLINEITDSIFGSYIASKRNVHIWRGYTNPPQFGWTQSVNRREWSRGYGGVDKYYLIELLVKESMRMQSTPKLLFSGDVHFRDFSITPVLTLLRIKYKDIFYYLFFNEVTYTAQTNQWSGEWIELKRKPDHESLLETEIIEETAESNIDPSIFKPIITPEIEINTGGILISGRTNFEIGGGGGGKSLFRPIVPVNEGAYRINSFGKDLSVTSSKGQHLITLTEKVIQLGILYNYHSLERLINGFFPQWRVPDLNDVTDLLNTVDLYSLPTGSLKSTESEFWESPNTAAMNLFGLNIRGGGIYVTEGRDTGFQNKRQQCGLWINEEYEGFGVSLRFNHDDDSASIYSEPVSLGLSVRLVRDADSYEVGLHDGTEVEGYTGNDGTKYRAVKIGMLVWITENLAETISNDGQPIPFGDFSEINWNEIACIFYYKEINNLYKESLKTPVYVDREFLDGNGSIYNPISLINLEDNKIYGIKNGKLVEITGGSGGGACSCAENVSCLVELPESEPCITCGAENISCLINLM